ncbi:MAG: aminoacyl-histidine dipeptidase [Salibacteraceae bacterium]
MSAEVRALEPKSVWNYFEDLNAIPRGSKKEDKIREFVKNFGLNLGLKTKVDEIGNVIIKKPATPGMEDRVGVILQGHIDMVWQKNADTDFDFDTQGIESYINGDWVTAKGTTLGADNGMGVAAAMALLASTNIPHPELEGLFTIDEETGMTGAKGLQGGELDGKILLNLDTEDDDELTIGCAGGVDTVGTKKYSPEVPNEKTGLFIKVSGLSGGHSGMDIHTGRGNANLILNRFLLDADKYDVAISNINGGGLRNAIPREANATLAVGDLNGFTKHVNELANDIKEELGTTDPNFKVELSNVDCPDNVMPKEEQWKLVRTLYTIPNNIWRMSPDMENLTETSSNLARVLVQDGSISIETLQRSSVDSQKWDIANGVRCSLEMMGAEVEHSGSYPGWTPKPDSPIVSVMANLYKEMYNEPAKVNACHAGLECGILGTNYPEVQMISFGPTIKGAHSPDERVGIKSVAKFWDFLLATLANFPKA